MPRPKFRSKNEREAYAVLRTLFPNTPIIHDYPVGGGLKVDFVIKTSVLIGVEIDGAQHFSYNSRWHKDKKDFEEQVRRDTRKEELCGSLGISLLRHDARKGIVPAQLKAQVLQAVKKASPSKKPCKPAVTKSEWMLQREKTERERRKERYKKFKEWKKNNPLTK